MLFFHSPNSKLFQPFCDTVPSHPIFHFQNINFWFQETVSFYLNECWTKYLKKIKTFDQWRTKAGSFPVDNLHLPVSYMLCAPFSSALGGNTKVFFPFLPQHSLLAWLLRLSMATRITVKAQPFHLKIHK